MRNVKKIKNGIDDGSKGSRQEEIKLGKKHGLLPLEHKKYEKRKDKVRI